MFARLCIFIVASAVESESLPVASSEPALAAVGSYVNQVNMTGWGNLSIKTLRNASAADQAFAAGFIEGKHTHEVIALFWNNYLLNNYGAAKQVPVSLISFMRTQQAW
jgi:hypothetical protein